LPYAKIIITQAAVSAAAGVARDDIDLFSLAGDPVYFSNAPNGDVGVSSWQWTLIERPPGSVVSLISATSPVCEVQPDAYGAYVVSLRVNGMGDHTDGHAKTMIACRYPDLAPGFHIGDWRAPAFNEGTLANYGGNALGAQPDIYKFMDEVRNLLMPMYWNIKAFFWEFSFPSHLTARSNLAAPAWATAGYLPLITAEDPADPLSVYNRAYFMATLFRNGAAGTAKVRLYDETNGVMITGTDLTTATGTIDDVLAGPLTIGIAPGNIRMDGPTRYRVDIEITGGTPVDFVEIMRAAIMLFRF